jgi:glycosyltransferase involved in cell wall biosynthesis
MDNQRMRFHVVALPHTQTTKYYGPCAYTQKVRRFCDMMMNLGHEVFLYASQDNEAKCTEFVTIVTKDEQREWFGDHDFHKEVFNITWGPADAHWLVSNRRASEEIGRRKQPRDFLCLIAGTCQQQIARAHPDLMPVEFGVGYQGTFSDYCVFESYAWMHAVYATHGGGAAGARGRFYDCVIPNYYEVEDFPFSADKDDYFLYLGRLTESKGVRVAVDTCRRLGRRLVVAGQGQPPDYGEFVGVVDTAQRGELMSRAAAVFVPTLYVEPFGGVHAEAMLCGTPVLTTDWGVFTETVQHGTTGFRCRTLAEFCHAAEEVGTLDYRAIRDYAVSRFATDVVALQYQRYFERLETLWGEGWYS